MNVSLDVSVRMLGVNRGKAGEGVALLVNLEVRQCVVGYKEVSPYQRG